LALDRPEHACAILRELSGRWRPAAVSSGDNRHRPRAGRRALFRARKRATKRTFEIERWMDGAERMRQLLLNILGFISFILTLYIYILIAYAVMSWLIAFNVVNTRHELVRRVLEFLYRITDPLLRPIRELLPNLGGIDISPIILWLIILFIQMVILPFIASLI
jgi:YggT family protein